MNEKKAELRQHLETSRQTLLDVISKIQGDAWAKPVQDSGERWTALQMVRHLQDAHQGLSKQLDRLREGQETVPQDFDLDRWNARVQSKTTEMTVEEALEALKASHERLLQTVDSLTEEDFQKTGWQPSLKKMLPLEVLIKVIGSHEANHAKDLENALK